jgi:hypothetical protein
MIWQLTPCSLSASSRARAASVGRRVLQVARSVGSVRDDRRRGDRLGAVVVIGDAELLEPAAVLGVLGLVAIEPVGAEHGALDEPAGDEVVGVVWELPAELLAGELTRAVADQRRDDAGALGIEALAVAEPGDDPALALGVGDRQVLELRLGLARVEQRLQLAPGRVVGDALAVEHADGDGVGVGVDGC